MNNEGTLVSILLLGWNHEAFIEQCINSVQQQTYRPIEVLFLDNRSYDGTYQKGIQLLENAGLPFMHFQNREGKSISENLNFLLTQASGSYVVPLSTDDWLTEICISRKIEYLLNNPQVGMLYSGGWIYYQDKDLLEEVDTRTFKRGRIGHHLLTQKFSFFFIGIMYPRAVLLDLNGWDENLLIEDLDLFIRLSQQYDVDFIDEPLAYYRKFSASAAGNISFMVKGWEQYYKKYQSRQEVSMEKWMAERYRMYAALAIDRNEFSTALRLCLSAMKRNVLNHQIYKTIFYLVRQYYKSL